MTRENTVFLHPLCTRPSTHDETHFASFCTNPGFRLCVRVACRVTPGLYVHVPTQQNVSGGYFE
ncbi:hypothetical protein EYF80_034107 [Liparis tanakae]|uniref:Uncharacterized protein n=1 Tax=Liparis tanakae TaxID=230148 RepID=A0A4Z2GSH3_9TELE|nr:hypothetical protein EYF80_034107 [Liparis tanakae]